MPITPVINGATITAAGIGAMHDSARSAINAILDQNLGRFTFNHEQLGSICCGANYSDTKTATTVEVTREVVSSELATPDLVPGTLTSVINFAPGDGTFQPCYILLFANFEVTGWAKRVDLDDARHMGVFALSVSIGGAAQNFPNGTTDQGIIRRRVPIEVFSDSAMPGAGAESTQSTVMHGSIMSIYDGSAGAAFTLSSINLWAAACTGGSSRALEDGIGGTGRYFRVPRASVSYLAIRAS